MLANHRRFACSGLSVRACLTALGRRALALLLCLPLTAWPQARLLPVDQATAVPEFFSFRAQMQAAVARRDAAALLAALSDDVKLSFGGDVGIEDFKRMWTPAAADSKLWETLATALALGGTFAADGSFTAPYVFTRWPRDKDAFTHLAAIGSGIRVRAAADPGAAVVGTLDFAIVELADAPSTDERWAPIKLAGGRTGYADRRFLRSPIDYRVTFVKQGGRWQISTFLAGD